MTHERLTLPPAGWHPDPTRNSQLRYWDGSTSWTEKVRPVTSEVGGDTPTSDTTPPHPAPGPRRSGAGVPPAPPESTDPVHTPIPPCSMRPQVTPQRPSREAGFFRSLFDLSFASDRVVTVSFARLLYLLVSIFSVLWWLIGAIFPFTAGSNENLSNAELFTVWGTLHLILGPIGAILTAVFWRVAQK